MSTLSQVARPVEHARLLWLRYLALASLVVVLYAPVLRGLVQQWWDDPDYGHGFLVPLFSLFLLWQTRARWQSLLWKPSAAGLPLMIAAIGLLLAGRLGAELFVSRVSLLVLLAGLVVYFAGWGLLRAWAFPLGFLLFMVPLPGIIYYQITVPLQLLASRLAGDCLDLLGVPALREGNLIVLPGHTLAVAEACSGIRSLISLLALAVAYGWLLEPRAWRRLALTAAMVPIAIISNGLRIVGTGVLTYRFGPQWAEGFFHFFSGWLIFVTALLLMLLTHRLLRRIYREKKEEAR